MSNLKVILLLFMMILLLNSCSTADIQYNGQQLIMQVDNTILHMDGRLIAKKSVNFRTLLLSEKILQSPDGNFIVYEDAKTDINYEFQFSLIHITKIVFDATRIYILYTTPKIQIYQLSLPNGQILNLVAQQSESQEIKYMYGMNADQLKKILKTLNADPRYRPYRNVMQLKDTFNTLQSRWTDWKVHFVPLVVPYQTFRYY